MNMKVKKLALAIGITFTTLAATPSYALLISTSIKTSATTSINGETVTDTNSSTTESLSEASLWKPDPVRETATSGASSAYGKETGESSLKSQGSEYTDRIKLSTPLSLATSAEVLHTAVITNDTGVSQHIDFDFLILAGSLNLGYSTTYGDGSTLIQSGYSADIRVDGISLWNSNANLTAVENWWEAGHTLATGGTTLGTLPEPGDARLSYQWESYAGLLDLGYLAAGSSITLEYKLKTYVNQYLADEGYAHTPRAEFDDPWSFNTSPLFDESKFIISTDGGTPTDVTEPAGTLLLGAGLAALAFRRKSRKVAV